MKLNIDNWRWADVPFYLRTGKRLPERAHRNCDSVPARAICSVSRHAGGAADPQSSSSCTFSRTKEFRCASARRFPGPMMRAGSRQHEFPLRPIILGRAPSTGYERLLYDCMIGDATLFQRADMVEAGWTVVTPVLDVWKALPPRNFPNYAAGTWGPKEADDLLARDGRRWRVNGNSTTRSVSATGTKSS